MYVVVPCLQEESNGSRSSIELLHSQSLHHLPVATCMYIQWNLANTNSLGPNNTQELNIGKKVFHFNRVRINKVPL